MRFPNPKSHVLHHINGNRLHNYVANLADAHFGCHTRFHSHNRSEEWKEKHRVALKRTEERLGRPIGLGNKGHSGKKLSLNHLKALREGYRRYVQTNELTLSPSHNKTLQEGFRKYWDSLSDEQKKKSEETRKRISEAIKEKWRKGTYDSRVEKGYHVRERKK